MKKILFILLIAGSVCGQTYPINPTLDSIRGNIFADLHIPTAGAGNVTTTNANLKINLALNKLCSDFDAYELIDTLYMTSDSDGVALPSDFLRFSACFRMFSGALIPMIEITHDSLWNIFITDSSGNTQNKLSYASPTYYRDFKDKFFTHPIVAKADTFVLYYFAEHPRLTSGSDSIKIESNYFDEFYLLLLNSIMEMRDR